MTDLGIDGIGDANLIASGASALVYSATNDVGDEVAIKLFRGIRGAEVARRFEREQQAAERLREHPNIIDVFGSGVSNAGEPYLVMPLMERGSLADELDTGAFPLDRAVADLLAVADAIDFAHRRGVLHRDIKPGNLLRTDDGSVAVADFGIARVKDAGINSATIGATTPLYAAPELLSENEASVQSDVYALGAVLYALLSGSPAFSDSPNIWATIARIRTEDPLPIPQVPAPIMRVIQQAMAKSPADRPPTAHQFHMNLLAARDAGEDWVPPSPAAATVPAPPPGPAMVPAIVVDDPASGARSIDRPGDHSPIAPAVAAPVAKTPSGPDDLGKSGDSSDSDESARSDRYRHADVPTERVTAIDGPFRRRESSLKVLAATGALVVLGGLAWLGAGQAFGGGEDDDATEITAPIDTSLPPRTDDDEVLSRRNQNDSASDPADDEPDDATEPAEPEPATSSPDVGDGPGSGDPASDDSASDNDPASDDGDGLGFAPDQRLVSFTGDHFVAYFPEGWAVSRSDVEVPYGFRSQFVGPDDMYITIDTTPAERRTGSTTIAESAREIAAATNSASSVTNEAIGSLEVHSFTFRNARGIASIDMFFEIDGDGYAIVAGSNIDTETVFAIARQVATTVRSIPST